MKRASIILAICALASCRGKSHPSKEEMVPCVVDSIAHIQRSTIEPEPRCEIYLDCGIFFSERCGRSKIGDTIYVHKK
jgi:hypothetical protein